jgi:HK97 family phage major capsid protein
MALEKSTTNEYLGNGPWLGGQGTLWGLPVAETPAMTPGSFLVGAFGLAATIYDREDVQVFLSSEDSDNFRRNLVTVLAEERLAMTVTRPEALIHGQFGAVT